MTGMVPSPPRHAEIRASYHSGPHGGFVQFYEAMKRMNPAIKVCETEEGDLSFLAAMGKLYPYDCVELHRYARPLDLKAPMLRYEQHLMYWPVKRVPMCRPSRPPVSTTRQARSRGPHRVRPVGGAYALR